MAGLALDRFDLQCGLAEGSTLCTGFSLLVGGAAGVFIGVREGKQKRRLWSAVTTAAIAALAASLGCLRLGVVGVASVVAGIALGVVGAATASRGG
jgi:hypothetical protein